ncbi:prepilin-type N-terminal cleavage/methylation domain-containing protein [Aquibacillus halophilus]|uniref:Prepilin-type N-terminal cleavage/methylation domain-containing protein n=1 Tax=Aquibacillus halophilus TaxID=930132 RepID=A0A6A8D6N2_9BACI|nr:prepilin-type N-terminal cleavage/methylation domain-containing protein [Aquibacillus halophilus]
MSNYRCQIFNERIKSNNQGFTLLELLAVIAI